MIVFGKNNQSMLANFYKKNNVIFIKDFSQNDTIENCLKIKNIQNNLNENQCVFAIYESPTEERKFLRIYPNCVSYVDAYVNYNMNHNIQTKVTFLFKDYNKEKLVVMPYVFDKKIENTQVIKEYENGKTLPFFCITTPNQNYECMDHMLYSLNKRDKKTGFSLKTSKFFNYSIIKKITSFEFTNNCLIAHLKSNFYNKIEMDNQGKILCIDFHSKIKNKLFLSKITHEQCDLNSLSAITKFITDNIEMYLLSTDKNYKIKLDEKEFTLQKNILLHMLKNKEEIQSHIQQHIDALFSFTQLEKSITFKNKHYNTQPEGLVDFEKLNHCVFDYTEKMEVENFFYFWNAEFDIPTVYDFFIKSNNIVNNSTLLESGFNDVITESKTQFKHIKKTKT